MIDYYDDVTKHEDPALTAKLATAAWWGGQGNTLPSTVWTFGQCGASHSHTMHTIDQSDASLGQQQGRLLKTIALRQYILHTKYTPKDSQEK